MDQLSRRAIVNCLAMLISGNAARNAFVCRDFLWAGVFSLITIAFLSGMLLHVAQHPLAKSVNHRLRGGGIYLFAAFTTALTVDDLMYMSGQEVVHILGWFCAASHRPLCLVPLFWVWLVWPC